MHYVQPAYIVKFDHDGQTVSQHMFLPLDEILALPIKIDSIFMIMGNGAFPISIHKPKGHAKAL